MRDNVPMTPRARAKTNGKTLCNGERSPRQARDDAAKAARVDAPEKVDDVVGSRPIARIGNLSSDLETPPPTTTAAATPSDDEEEGVADEEVVRLAVDRINIGAIAGMDGGTGALKKDDKLRAIVASLAKVDAAQGKERSLLRNFRRRMFLSAKKSIERIVKVFGSCEVKVCVFVSSPFKSIDDMMFTNHETFERALSSQKDSKKTKKMIKLAVSKISKKMAKILHKLGAAKRREKKLQSENERLRSKLADAEQEIATLHQMIANDIFPF